MGQRETLEKIKQKLEGKIVIDEIYLFGSRAKGTYNRSSDLDIAIVSESFRDMSKTERYHYVINEVREVTGDTPVDVLCYTSSEFERGSDSFLPSIIQDEGISV
ncbi:MAG: nucleotidyltransferase domain-containing protein [Candidatus Nanohaloarchaea archaeon]